MLLLRNGDMEVWFPVLLGSRSVVPTIVVILLLTPCLAGAPSRVDVNNETTDHTSITNTNTSTAVAHAHTAQNRTLIIGDVHGCTAELDRLLVAMQYNNATDEVIFVGDVINKGCEAYPMLSNTTASFSGLAIVCK